MEALPDGVLFKFGVCIAEIFLDGQIVHLLLGHSNLFHELLGKRLAHMVIFDALPDLALLMQDAGMGIDAVGLVHVHGLLGDGASGGVQGGNLIAQIPEAFHIGFQLPLAPAGILAVANLCTVHGAAHQGQLVVNGHVFAGYIAVVNQEDCRGQTCHTATNNVRLAILDTLRLVGTDIIKLFHNVFLQSNF